MINPIHFFDPVEGFIQAHPGTVQIAVLNALSRNAGCPDNLIDAVINSVIAGIVQANIAPKFKSVTVTDAAGNIIPDNRVNPTKSELVAAITQKFDGITFERATQLIDYLLYKNVLTSDSGYDKLYMLTPLVACQLVVL